MSKDRLPFIIAVDFDGTLVDDAFPEVGTKDDMVFELCKTWKAMGAKLILWTCRDNQRLVDAVQFCREHGLNFDAVNQNVPEVQELYGGDTRKVFADVYLDDKAIELDSFFHKITRRFSDAIGEIDSEEDN